MSAPLNLNFNELIPSFEKRTCQIGDQTFDITNVPMGVGVCFTRSRIDPRYPSTDALIDATLIMLNQAREQKDQVDRAWLEQNVPGSVFSRITDQILAPFWNPPKKEGGKEEIAPQKKL
jgi:hypothetical protein